MKQKGYGFRDCLKRAFELFFQMHSLDKKDPGNSAEEIWDIGMDEYFRLNPHSKRTYDELTGTRAATEVLQRVYEMALESERT